MLFPIHQSQKVIKKGFSMFDFLLLKIKGSNEDHEGIFYGNDQIKSFVLISNHI